MAFKVFDLQCEHGHVFEGWFGSHGDYESQSERKLIACPLCESTSVAKKLSAPMLNVANLKAAKQAPAAPQPETQQVALQAEVLRHMREVLRQTENVGEGFAAEARRIHHGEAPERPIRGVTTPVEREELADEGIAVMPVPDILDDDRMQ